MDVHIRCPCRSGGVNATRITIGCTDKGHSRGCPLDAWLDWHPHPMEVEPLRRPTPPAAVRQSVITAPSGVLSETDHVSPGVPGWGIWCRPARARRQRPTCPLMTLADLTPVRWWLAGLAESEIWMPDGRRAAAAVISSAGIRFTIVMNELSRSILIQQRHADARH